MKTNRVKLEDARNLGPQTAAEMETLGFKYLDQIEEIGWEEFCIKYCEYFPHRLNLNAFAAIIGAIEDEDWRKISPALKNQAKQLIRQIKAGLF